MNYSIKLKKALEEIKQVMESYDIAGTIVLHTPGFSEFLIKMDPSYSCAKMSGHNLVLSSKLKDFNGDEKAFNKSRKDTANMFKLLSSTSGNTALELLKISDYVDKVFDAEHGDESFTDDIISGN